MDWFTFADVVDFIKSSVNIIDCIATMSFYIDLVILKSSQKKYKLSGFEMKSFI